MTVVTTVIKITGDPQEIDGTIDKLKEVGMVDEANAKSFKENSAKFRKEADKNLSSVEDLKKSVDQIEPAVKSAYATDSLKKFNNEVLNTAVNYEKISKKLKFVESEILSLEQINAEFKNELVEQQQILDSIGGEWNKMVSPASKNVKKLEAAIKDNNAALSKMKVEAKVLRATGKDAKKAAGLHKTLGGQLSEIVDQMARMEDKGSDAYNELAHKAADLKSAQDDARLAVNHHAEEYPKLHVAVETMETLAGGAELVAGAQALAGTESEQLVESIHKLVAIQTFASGVQKTANSLKKEGALVTGLVEMRTKALANASKIAATAQALYATVIGTSTGALKLFRLALIGTGIGAIIVGIGLLIANFETVKDTVMGIIDFALKPFKSMLQSIGVLESDEDRARTERHKKQVERLQREAREIERLIKKTLGRIETQKKFNKEFIDDANTRIDILKAQGATEEEIAREELLLAREVREQKKNIRQQIGNDEVDARRALEKDLKDRLGIEMNLRTANKDEIVKLQKTLETNAKGQIAGVSKAEADALVLRFNAFNNFRNERIDAVNELEDAEAAYIIEVAEKEQEELKKRQEAWQEYSDNTKELLRDLEDIQIDLMEDAEERQIARINLDFQRRKQEIQSTKASEKAKNDLIIAEEKLRDNKIKEIRDESAAEKREKAQEELQAELEREEEQLQMLRELRASEQQKELDRLAMEFDEKFLLAQGNAELEAELIEEQESRIKKIRDHYRELDMQAAQEALDRKKELAEQELESFRQRTAVIEQLSGQLTQAFIGDQEERTKSFLDFVKMTLDVMLKQIKAELEAAIFKTFAADIASGKPLPLALASAAIKTVALNAAYGAAQSAIGSITLHEGTEFVKARPGAGLKSDETYAKLQAGEAVVRKQMNSKYSGLSKAMNEDKVDWWVQKYHMFNNNSLEDARSEKMAKDIANNFFSNQLFDDKGIKKELRNGFKFDAKNTKYLAKVIKQTMKPDPRAIN